MFGRMQTRRIEANGIEHEVATAGSGSPVLLLHGFPHTWFLWRDIMTALAPSRFVIAPDLRGLGGTTRTERGYDLDTLVADQLALLDALDVREPALVVGIDLGAPVAFALAMRHPTRVRRLAVMESLLGRLPGAEGFLANGPPWWFGFHAVPNLPELLVEGHEDAYLDYFLTNGTKSGKGIAREARDRFVAAYRGRESLRAAFDHYRAIPSNGRAIAAMCGRLTVPTLAVVGGVVGDAIAKQLAPITDELQVVSIPACGHLIPEEQPAALAAVLLTA